MAQGAIIEVVGVAKVRQDLAGIAERMLAPGEVLALEMKVLEESERSLFEGYGGEYVQSGATLASLTQSGAEGAIRRVHANSIEFGSSIWYAKFQREIGGPSGKPRGRKRVGPSKILKLTDAERVQAAETVMARIMGRL
jgi:hypothetical protein